MRRILSDQPLRPSELVAIRKLRQHLAKSVRDDFQYKVRFVRVGKTIVARIVEISVSDEPPAVGALPEPAPKPKLFKLAAESWFHTISADVDDAGEMHLTIDGQPEPYHGPERPQVWTRCAGDGAAICAQCKKTFFQADGEECLCHVCWAASLTLGGITPPWPGGAA